MYCMKVHQQSSLQITPISLLGVTLVHTVHTVPIPSCEQSELDATDIIRHWIQYLTCTVDTVAVVVVYLVLE